MSDEERTTPPPGGGAEGPAPDGPAADGAAPVAPESPEAPPPAAAAKSPGEEPASTPPPAVKAEEPAEPARSPPVAAKPAEPPAKPAETAPAKPAAPMEPPAKPAEAAPAKPAVPAAAKPPAPARPPRPDPKDLPPWERDADTPEWVDADDDPLAGAVRERFGEALTGARSYAGDLTLELATDRVAEVSRFLKDEHGFTYLIDLCGADYPEREPRFDVVYQLHSFTTERRIRLRVKADENDPVPTVSGVWRVANWCEREAYDMYGIRFADHPDLTRILLWEGFNGYPLRKDFPVEGIDTGSAIYPEYYTPDAGPVAGTGTGWKAPKPPEPPADPPEGEPS